MPIKIGVLGCSSIAERLVIPAIVDSNRFELSGVASRSIAKANIYAKNFNTVAYSYEQLLNSDVDAIYVSLPVGLHYEWGKRVLKSKKHLLLEKTFTQTLDQAKELFTYSKIHKLACMEALMYQYHPMQKQIKHLASKLGKIKQVEAHFGFPHMNEKNNIRYSKELGGGATLDCLVYPLSFVFNILSSDYNDYKCHLFYDHDTGIDERGYIQLKYDDSVANISYGFGHSYRNEVTIWGDNSILKVNRAFTRPEDCEAPIELWRNGTCKKFKAEQSNHFVDMLDMFLDNIKTLKNDSESVLKRVHFVNEILNSNGDVL